MLDIIIEMIEDAYNNEDYNLINYAKKLIYELSSTYNAPSNWRDIPEELLEKYKCEKWIYDNLELWEYEEY